LPRTKLLADTRHLFLDELKPIGPVTHLRLNVFPDGGVSRMRVHALPTERGRGDAAARHLDTLIDHLAFAELRHCCASNEWVQQLVAARPFGSWEKLAEAADRIWLTLGRDAWLEAFSAHPRIGEKKADRFSTGEQSGTASASAETMSALAEVNREYEAKYGHVYLVCASGRSADEMLAFARERMANTADDELRIAAEEQRKITRLRLLKLV
jgi:allantoicase